MNSFNIDLHNTLHKIYLLVGMTVIWTILYIIVHIGYRPSNKINPKIVLDTKNRIISIIHGVGSFIMASIVFLDK
jgi:hypothetical protein